MRGEVIAVLKHGPSTARGGNARERNELRPRFDLRCSLARRACGGQPRVAAAATLGNVDVWPHYAEGVA